MQCKYQNLRCKVNDITVSSTKPITSLWNWPPVPAADVCLVMGAHQFSSSPFSSDDDDGAADDDDNDVDDNM